MNATFVPSTPKLGDLNGQLQGRHYVECKELAAPIFGFGWHEQATIAARSHYPDLTVSSQPCESADQVTAILVPSTPRLLELNQQLQLVLNELRQPRCGFAAGRFWLLDRRRIMKRMLYIEIEAQKEARRIVQA